MCEYSFYYLFLQYFGSTTDTAKLEYLKAIPIQKYPFFLSGNAFILTTGFKNIPPSPWKPRRYGSILQSVRRGGSFWTLLWQYFKLFMILNVCHQLKYKTHRCLFVWVHIKCARSWLRRGQRRARWRRFISSGIWCTCHVCKFNGRST